MIKGTLLIKNGRIVNSKREFKSNILIKNGKIVALLKDADNCEVEKTIDAMGRYIIPGAVDTHTHMMDPGYTERENFTTGTKAAAYGGITTVVTHHRTVPPVYSVKELNEKISYLSTKSVVDFGLKGGCSPTNIDKLKDMWERGVTGFKMFTCDLHGVKAMYPGFLFNTFSEIVSLGAIALIHCEDNNITLVNEEKLKKEGRKDYLSHIEWRSDLAEKIAVETVISIAKETGARVTIAHVSQPTLLKEVKEARDDGFPIFAETCPQYFYLTIDDLVKKGPWVKFTPPMKTRDDIEKMWDSFNKGYVSIISSDHCPHQKEIKKQGEKNIWNAPNGIPGVETSLKLMLNAVNNGKTNLNRVVETMCENPAKIYGLYPKKGVIEIGTDADIVILDMDKEEILSHDKVVSKCKWTPYDGFRIKGIPDIVMVRGKIVLRDGKVIGKPGMGQFVPRQKDISSGINI